LNSECQILLAPKIIEREKDEKGTDNKEEKSFPESRFT